MTQKYPLQHCFARCLLGCPAAVAHLCGSPNYPTIHGLVRCYRVAQGVLLSAEIYGLPDDTTCAQPVLGFHIHSGSACTGTASDPFADAAAHLNPKDCPHPYHAGDLPPLFAVDGTAFLVCLTGRFSLSDIIGHAVILHRHPDDFTTQPAGHAGEKIACGILTAC